MEPIFVNDCDKNKYFIATYDLESSTNLRDAAWNLAIGQSVGNPNVRNNWETDELFNNYSCKVLGDEDVMKLLRQGVVKIGFPIINTDWEGDGISHLLCQLMGGQTDINIITKCRLIDIKFPEKVLKFFKGPKFGMSGFRKFCGVYDKPLLGGIIKPKTGISKEVLLEMVKEMVEGTGINFIKEDEILSNPSFCPIEERVPLIMDYLKNKNVVYCVCINGDPLHILNRAKKVAELGGNGIHVNFWCGLGVYKSLRDLDLPLFLHFQTSGSKILTDPSHRFSIDFEVVCYLAALSGVDFAHIGMIGGYTNSEENDVLEILKMMNSNNSVPTLSCGMHPGLVEYITKKTGNDYLANCGGALHGHPMGTSAGVKAMKQAIEGLIEKDEYKVAVEKWGCSC
jgi:ribulose 1,5-bisphosphate carboxylase large subunit-like protein